jgi:ubiquinone/menaquinone biosynthesis C-methylase UbiE
MLRGKVFPATQARSLLNPLRRLVQSPRRSVGAMRVSSSAHVLEVGSGPGWFTPSIAKLVRDGDVVAVDLQPEMVRIARDRVAAPNAAFACGDAIALPFASSRFDAVFVATMLGEVPDRSACIAEVRRVLKAGGVLAVAETRRDSDFIDLTGLRALVEQRCFTFDGSSGIRWQYVARFVAI